MHSAALGALLVSTLLLAGSACTPTATDRGGLTSQGPAVSPARARTLAPFFERLAELESGRADRPVAIVQLGDSHTAGDRFSGRLRELFQQRFGASGRGMMAAGVPFDYYRPQLVTVQQSDGWAVSNSVSRDSYGLFGLTGFRLRAEDRNDFMTVQSDEPTGFDRIGLQMLRQPGGGGLQVEVDGRVLQQVPTAGDIVQAARLDLDVPAGSRSLTVRPVGNGPVDLMSWTVERASPGVILDNFGIVGATVSVMDKWEPNTFAWELSTRDPGLVILAYGTNEGFNDTLSVSDYARFFAGEIARLKRAAPDAAILIVGPPDGNRLPRGCRDERRRPNEEFSCAALSPTETAQYSELFSSPAAGSSACRWHPPPNLAAVREAQRRVADQAGVYFWDWSRVMGGACGMHEWTEADPQLAYGDHVHLQTAGYAASADALFRELMANYATWRGRPLAEQPAIPAPPG